MNLNQLLSLEGITDYNIWWYGIDYVEVYMNDDGLLNENVEIKKGKPVEGRYYLVMAGINGKKCRYRFTLQWTGEEYEGMYRMKRIPIQLDEYAGRLILYRETGFSFYNSASSGKNFVVDEIWGKEENRNVVPFSDYDSVELSFSELKEVVDGHYSDYYKPLSSVKGIYMIVDGNTGKLYVGSAYGSDGIWGRWTSYANTLHGGNLELKKLYDEYGEKYFDAFKYIILHILPMKISDKEIIDIETKYKNRYLTKEFGWNDN